MIQQHLYHIPTYNCKTIHDTTLFTHYIDMSVTIHHVVFYFNIMFTNSEEKYNHSSNLLVIHILIILIRTTILHFKEHDLIFPWDVCVVHDKCAIL